MLCKDVMWSGPVVIAPEETAFAVARKLANADVGSLPVADEDGRHLGMVTERAILRQIVAEGLDPKITRVAMVIDRRIPAVDPDDPAAVALKRMDEANTRWLPVVQAGRIVGMGGSRDIRRAAGRDDSHELHAVTDAALLH
jgi:CBS domain-containing protein